MTEAQGPFELGECSGQIALAEGQQTDPPRGNHEAPGVRHRLGNLERFFPEGTTLSEQAELGMACGQMRTGQHGGRSNGRAAKHRCRSVFIGDNRPRPTP